MRATSKLAALRFCRNQTLFGGGYNFMKQAMGVGLFLMFAAAPAVLSAQAGSQAPSAAYERAAEAASRLDRQQPPADAAAKLSVYVAAMEAAQKAGNVEKTLEWGERALMLDPNHRFAQMYVSSALPERLPANEQAHPAILTRAMDLANKAHNQTEAFFKGPKPANVTEEAWAEEKRILEARVHATLGTIHLIRKEYEDSVFMYEYVVELTPEDGLSQYRLGMAYSGQATEAEQTPPADRVDDPVERRDKAIDSLARAVALGGSAAQQARPELEKLYRAKNSNSLAGLDALINAKKTEIGAQ
jgi:hypothetical protein